MDCKFGFFIYLFTHYFKTVKKLDINRYVQLTRWFRGIGSNWGARGPEFDLLLWQGFLAHEVLSELL